VNPAETGSLRNYCGRVVHTYPCLVGQKAGLMLWLYVRLLHAIPAQYVVIFAIIAAYRMQKLRAAIAHETTA